MTEIKKDKSKLQKLSGYKWSIWDNTKKKFVSLNNIADSKSDFNMLAKQDYRMEA